MVVRDSKRKKARASPGHMNRVREFFNVLNYQISTKKIKPLVKKNIPTPKKALKLLTLMILSELK